MSITPMPVTIRFTVCVLNWNSRAYLRDCLDALYEQTQPDVHIMVVDNGSTDDSVAFTREHFPHVVIREAGHNLGYAGGNNIALRDFVGDVVFVLNPDVILSRDCLAQVAAVLSADATIGIAGCKLWYPGSDVIQHAGGIITHPRAVPDHLGIGEHDDGRLDKLRDVDFVTGAAIAIRRETIERIGLLDDGIFLYFEDVDYCARARRAGLRVVCAPKATGVHIESATSIKGSFAYTQHFHTGRWYYLLKHFSGEEIAENTLPAEIQWLSTLPPQSCRALTLSYRAILTVLPTVWSARESEGAGALDEGTRHHLEEMLLTLYREAQARGRSSDALARLAANAQLMERPFTSQAPLFGPLITWVRSRWNDVASRWYLRHLMEQQNRFNHLVLQQLQDYEAELVEQLSLLEEQLLAQVEAQKRVRELQVLLADLARERRRNG